MKVGCLIRFADDSYCAPSVRGKIGIVTDVSGQSEGPGVPTSVGISTSWSMAA